MIGHVLLPILLDPNKLVIGYYYLRIKIQDTDAGIGMGLKENIIPILRKYQKPFNSLESLKPTERSLGNWIQSAIFLLFIKDSTKIIGKQKESFSTRIYVEGQV